METTASININAVSMSFGRACLKGDLIGRFYDIFLESNPVFKPMFANTDFKKQKDLLRHGVNLMIMYAKGSPSGKNGLGRIKSTHKRTQLNIDPKYYGYWKRSLIQAIKEFDPEFTPELERAWNEVVEHGVKYISSGYEGH